MSKPDSASTPKKTGIIKIILGLIIILSPFLALPNSNVWLWIFLWILGGRLLLKGIGSLMQNVQRMNEPITVRRTQPIPKPLPARTAAPGQTEPVPNDSAASNPGCLKLSMTALQLFHPYLVTGNAHAHAEDAELFTKFHGVTRDWALWRIQELIGRGDSRPAVVAGVSDKLLIIGAYSDDFDACVFLVAHEQLARQLIRKHQLQKGSRLIAVNNFHAPKPDGSIQADIHVGEFAKTKTWSGVWPVIADFVSDDDEQLEVLRANISDQEWQRATDLAFAEYDGGFYIRRVEPFRSLFEGQSL